jgi:DNA-binding CsgD family transcriptional regulator
VLEGLCAGDSRARIASKLGIGRQQVNRHVSGLYRATGMSELQEVLVWGRREGVCVGTSAVDHDPEPVSLRQREFEAVVLLAGGLTRQEICQRMSIARSTLAHHLSLARAVLDLREIQQLVVWAWRTGLCDNVEE